MLEILLQGLNSAQQRELQVVALVPVANNTRLLPPERLFLRLRDNLKPFAYELPVAFTAHTGVLQELGMKQEPSASDLVKLVVVSPLACCPSSPLGQDRCVLGRHALNISADHSTQQQGPGPLGQ